MADEAIIVELPDGNEAEFPAGTSRDVIQGVLRKRFPPKAKASPSSPPPSIEGVSSYEGEDAEASQTVSSIASGLSPHVPAISGAAGALRTLGGIPRGESFEQALTAGQKTMEEVASKITVPLPDTPQAKKLQEYAHFPFKTINKAAEKLGDLSMWVSPNSPNLAAVIASMGEFAAYSLIFRATRSNPKARMADAEKIVEKMAAEEIAKREGQPRALPPGPSAAPKKLTEGPLGAEAEGGRARKPAGAFPLPPETKGALPERAGGPFAMPSVEESYALQAKELGIEFRGMQETGIEGRPAFPIFQDPVSTTSFTRVGRESVSDALMRKRREFGKDQTPGEPVDVVGAQYEASLDDLMLEKVYEKAQAEYGAREAEKAADVRFAKAPDTQFGETVPGGPTRRVVEPTPTGAVSSIVRAYRDSVELGQMNPRVASAEMIRRGQSAAREGNEYAAGMYWREAREIYFSKNNRSFLADERGFSAMHVDAAKWLIARSEKFRDALRSGRTGFLDFFTPGNLASEYWREFVTEKGSAKAGRMLESKYFWEDFRKAVPDSLSRQAMTLLIQTGGDAAKAREYLPRIAEHDSALAKGVAQVIDRMEKLPPAEREMANLVRTHLNEMFKTGVEESVLATYFKDYVTQLWKERITQPKKGTALRSRMLNSKFQFAKERFYTNYLEGMAEGLKPYTLDIADIGRVYDAALARTIFHKQVIDKLQETGMMKYANAGDIPEGWVSTERLVPASRQHMIDLIREEMFKRTGKALDSNALKDILPQFTYAKVYVHPDAYPILKQFFGRGMSGQDIIVFSNLKKAAIATKQMILSLSGFHYKNLFTTAFDQARHGKDPVSVLIDGLKMNADPAKAKWWVEHDLRIGPADAGDAYMNMARATIGEPARAHSAWTKIKDKAYSAYRGNQKMLWEKFVPALKLADAELELSSRVKAATMRGETLTEAQIAKMAKGISEVVNRKYGILNWEKMGTTPMAKDVLQTLLLAPDWTLSNLMYLRSAFKEGIEGSKARRDIATSILIWQVSLNALNYAFSAHNEQRKDESFTGALARGAGHTAWQNPPGRRLYLELPGRSREGRRFFGEVLSPGNLKDITRFVMGFGDVTEWQRFASGKMHTFPKTSMEILMNKDWAGEDIMDRNDAPWRQAFSLMGHVARQPMPIPAQAVAEYATGRKEGIQSVTSGLGLGAVTKGPSATVVIGWIKHGLQTGDTQMIQRALETAADEGIPIDMEKLMRQETFRQFMREQRASQTPIPALNKLLKRK